jgi:xanthine dehydrogenase small subunit
MLDMKELKHITETDDMIAVGGSATMPDLMASPVMNQYFPRLDAWLQPVSSTTTTVAGNLVNASPIGDLTIWFLALDATVVLTNGKKREVPLRDFYQGYKVIDKSADEVLEKIRFRKPGPEDFFNFEKASKGKSRDSATVNTAIYMRIMNDIIVEAHVSAGGVSPIPLYLKNLSSCLMHKKLPLDQHTWQELDFLLQSEIAPVSDVYGSETHKRASLEQLFHAHFAKLVPQHE